MAPASSRRLGLHCRDYEPQAGSDMPLSDRGARRRSLATGGVKRWIKLASSPFSHADGRRCARLGAFAARDEREVSPWSSRAIDCVGLRNLARGDRVDTRVRRRPTRRGGARRQSFTADEASRAFIASRGTRAPCARHRGGLRGRPHRIRRPIARSRRCRQRSRRATGRAALAVPHDSSMPTPHARAARGSRARSTPRGRERLPDCDGEHGSVGLSGRSGCSAMLADCIMLTRRRQGERQGHHRARNAGGAACTSTSFPRRRESRTTPSQSRQLPTRAYSHSCAEIHERPRGPPITSSTAFFKRSEAPDS